MKELIPSIKEPIANAQWVHVIANPETIKIQVLYKGKFNTGIVTIPTGGHWPPKIAGGHKAVWKKDQKKPKNNINSETINKKTASDKFLRTTKVWSPLLVASKTISENQKYADKHKAKKPNNKKNPPNNILCI